MVKKTNVKIVSFDIETMANIGYYFELYREGNIVQNVKHWYMLSFSWKWLHEEQTRVIALPDFASYKSNPEKAKKELVEKLWQIFDEADMVIAHNGQAFDVKKANALFLKYHLKPPSPYKVIDTKLIAKRYFRFDSNKLDDLADFLSIGRKLNTGGFQLWIDCEKGDKKAWDKMKRYNKHDTVLLEKVYLRMLPYITNHPDINIYAQTVGKCPNCSSSRLTKRGYHRTKRGVCQRFQCQECGAWTKGERLLE